MEGAYETALMPPPPPVTPLPRPRVTKALRRAARRPLTVVSAPAGFGKSVALGDWHRASGDHERIAWVTLGAGDDDPRRFWSAVVAAVRTALPQALDAVATMLAEGHQPAGVPFTHTLVNDLCRVPEPCVVVVDDFQVVTSRALLDDLTVVVEHLPPGIRLVLATRADPALPLRRWRTRGVLSEIRADKLRFTGDEARAYLDLTVAGELSSTDTDMLVDRCDGWIACLYLASLRVLELDDLAEFVAALAATAAPLADFLVGEVLASLPDETRTFLEETSVLDDLAGELCDAVTGRSGGGETLERLHRAGLFASRTSTNGWYRYHPLLRALLRARLRAEPDALAVLHRRAAEWRYAAGQSRAAIEHAISAGAVDLAAAWLVERTDELLAAGPDVVPQLLATMPGEPSVGRSRFRSLRLRAAMVQGAVNPMLGHAMGGDSVAASCRVAAMVLQGDHAEAAALLTGPDAGRVPTDLHRLLLGHVLTASRDYERAAILLRQVPRDGRLDRFAALAATALLAWNQVAAGRLGAGAALATEAIDRAVELGCRWFHPLRFAELALARVQLDRGNTEEAYRLATLAAEAPSEDAFASMIGAVLRARIGWALGDRTGAREVLNAAVTGPDGRPVAGDLALRLAYAQTELYWLELDATLAQSWLPDWRSRLVQGPACLEERLLLARFLIADDRPGEARALLEEPDAGLRTVRYEIEAAKLATVAAVKAGDPAAPMLLEVALAMGQPERYVQTYVDDAATLAALGREADTGITAAVGSVHSALVNHRARPDADAKRPAGRPAAALVEELTERELAVLRLLPTRLSNKEIAHELFVSVNTIKSHAKSIYRKLDVTSRNSAVDRAVALRIT